jgi:hypothetical protein
MSAHGSRTVGNGGSAAIDPAIDPSVLDCWEVNLAVALRALGAANLSPLLGAQWWFQLADEYTDDPVLDFEDPLDRISRLTGLRMSTRPLSPGRLVPLARAVIEAGGVPLVVSDAFVMPWVPYAGHKHVEHSFVVQRILAGGGYGTGDADGSGVGFVDAYANRTEWGDATPVTGEADPATVDAVERAPGARFVAIAPPTDVGAPVGVISSIDQAELLGVNLIRLRGWNGPDEYVRYAERHCAAGTHVDLFDAFCQTCWALERRRALNARWLADLTTEATCVPADLPARFEATVVRRWADVNRFTYLALRRMRAGRPPGGQLVDLVRAAAVAEAALVDELVAASAAGRC